MRLPCSTTGEWTTTTAPSLKWSCGEFPAPVPPSIHGLKYSLFYGWPGVREVGYDNERGKGDHRHFQGTEAAYKFVSVEQLIADFWLDVRRLRGVR